MPVARNGDQDDEFYSEPTQYANYGGSGGQAYSEVPNQPEYTGYQTGYETEPVTGHAPTPPPETPWYRKPAALLGLGALAALVIALLIYAVIQLAGGSSSTTETTTTTTTPSTTSESVAPAPGVTETVTQPPAETSEASPTETVTETPTTTTTEAPVETTTTTTTPPSASTVTETQTQTETVTQSRTLPTLPTLFPRPGNGGGGQ